MCQQCESCCVDVEQDARGVCYRPVCDLQPGGAALTCPVSSGDDEEEEEEEEEDAAPHSLPVSELSSSAAHLQGTAMRSSCS